MNLLKNKSKVYLIIFFTILFFPIIIFAKAPPPGTGKADVKANILLMLDNSGSMGWTTNTPNRPLYPTDVCTDSNGNKYVVEYYYHRVKKYDASGKYLKTIGSYGTGNYGFRYPTKCAIDSNDNLFVYICIRVLKGHKVSHFFVSLLRALKT